ncbi:MULTISPECIES: flagellar basal body rod protein FlgF [Sphingopyxis]|uniref:Flagellar basal-body rod protein FlgF n=1 Tax=Sphingopyxis granuli TaxID=267128 RepID=A0AA86GZM2_9SPHN|nr:MULTISPECIES: flagellar basal body rod protein FlgF [Sphingopyxis]AMG76443.1 Flagellar basal-body rod protein FlgF [Sphingopyxis granuli]APW73992.1 flagellar biosynthesis protein FlgF [Sphingopyxis granuli]AVA15323.1 flagellar basal body rod protein FlgF [Sphingopyxis sp. MG]ODU28521.1 MAG: flagellar biosynthesis protein FlgF [Sphingopyxis sp. SCN 67-31]QUM72666.1 flagellar basal body rod protein FlgF [Sphingopyxis granuli]
MDRLIYTSLTAMRGSMARQTAIANNLANVQTPGFRGEMAEAQSLWLHGAGFDARAMASEEVVGADMRAGTIAATGRDLDIAMQGDAMLVVQAPDGEQAYTRRGDLQLSPSGLLTTGDNHPVQGAQGPITLPPADSVKIDAEGRIWVVPAGGDPENPQEIDRLRLATPAGSEIVKGLDGLFRVRGGGILPDDPEARVVTRSLEGSNVTATAALVEMIEASKQWDSQLKLISDARDMDSATANLMQLPR